MSNPSVDPNVEVYADCEGESIGLAYGAITFAVRPCSSSLPHSHRSEELWLVQSGSGWAAIDGHRTELKPGARLAVPAGREHHIVNPEGAPLVVLSFWWRGRAGES